tara:strand:+ start:810 stop:1232 length:423 start_codon:yes stop_codon:yes gene_type:complete
MNKQEKNLVAALKGGNYDNANEALSVFSALKSTTDEQANNYFDKVEALQEVVVESKVEEVAVKEEVIAEEVVEPIVVIAPRVEKRGVKAKSKSRKDVEKAFNNAVEVAMAYKDENRRTSEGKFALRLVRQLGFIKKRLFR